ncbi:MAG: hypothetical protein N3E38_01525 [Candidatus Aenigmarchaeota archaeon]|nr:hypothetical protein [Candidatus Aenigmarchaeota archaeon]
MALNIVQKYKLNTEDFKIYFDNNKKTHVAENIETGEKTNIGVLGIFLEMGILRPLDEEDKLIKLERKMAELEKKLEMLIDKVENIQMNFAFSEKKSVETEEKNVEKVKEKPKFDIREKIIEKSLSKIKYDENVIKDSDDEEKVWEEI